LIDIDIDIDLMPFSTALTQSFNTEAVLLDKTIVLSSVKINGHGTLVLGAYNTLSGVCFFWCWPIVWCIQLTVLFTCIELS